MSDIGENEDEDVKAERLKVKNLMDTQTKTPPVAILQVRSLISFMIFVEKESFDFLHP